ncbi:type II toxin-antitoxin system VapC family toxin [Sphingomonas sp. ABOLE]|uniref:type II toxin-antitoxin system VapC family toxin n=1 Tax=Sphingomonas sp. ABOLE TaxID=1985878 RepID=UPI000F7D6B05|nr:type II toxin-antitoxin system VapC family toxin [Sphingomonas sp. ABOLE]RSV42820.1 type II toxin-antitoxin system VapC family toxin [Sphingomonas sp. ABOLE]
MAEPRFLLDTNICIYILSDAHAPAALAVEAQAKGSVVSSTIVLAEVLRGVPESHADGRLVVERFFRLVEPLPFDAAAAEAYARLPFRRARLDRLIAAQALAAGLTLITNNERDFADIPDLKLENWTL